jgi:uncharacterized protein related to proFAR isomerase
MNRIVNSFRWGFLSDRIVKSLTDFRKNKRISEEEKVALDEGIDFIDMILKGGKQITEGIVVSNALESLTLYNKSLPIVLDMPNLPQQINAKTIERIFEEFKDNLKQISNGVLISDDKLVTTTGFFNALREKTLEDSTAIMNGLYESRRSDKWELALET